MKATDLSDLHRAEQGLARLLVRVGVENTAELSAAFAETPVQPDIHAMGKDEFARFYEIKESVSTQAFSELESDFRDAEIIAGAAHLHRQLGAHIEEDEKEIVRRGKEIWGWAIMAKDLALRQAVRTAWGKACS